MLGNRGIHRPLLSILAHDPGEQRSRARPTNLARSGMLTASSASLLFPTAQSS